MARGRKEEGEIEFYCFDRVSSGHLPWPRPGEEVKYRYVTQRASSVEERVCQRSTAEAKINVESGQRERRA